jgi:CcmD family protein
MRHVNRALRVAAMILVLMGGGMASAVAQPTGQPAAAQDEFVPIGELPVEDQLPAAPFLVAAYTVVWVLLIGYVWMLWQRLARVQRELADARRSTRSP